MSKSIQERMEEFRSRPRQTKQQIMQELLDAGVVRPECVDEFKRQIALAADDNLSVQVAYNAMRNSFNPIVHGAVIGRREAAE